MKSTSGGPHWFDSVLFKVCREHFVLVERQIVYDDVEPYLFRIGPSQASERRKQISTAFRLWIVPARQSR